VRGTSDATLGHGWRREEGVEVDHVARHVVGPFEDLRSDVNEDGIGGTSAKKDHDIGGGMVREEESHVVVFYHLYDFSPTADCNGRMML
jgi:hypothetical protein